MAFARQSRHIKYLVLNVSNFVGKFGENLLKPLHTLYKLYVMFNKRVGVFYHNIKHDA
jgi:hypothetical protein